MRQGFSLSAGAGPDPEGYDESSTPLDAPCDCSLQHAATSFRALSCESSTLHANASLVHRQLGISSCCHDATVYHSALLVLSLVIVDRAKGFETPASDV